MSALDRSCRSFSLSLSASFAEEVTFRILQIFEGSCDVAEENVVRCPKLIRYVGLSSEYVQEDDEGGRRELLSFLELGRIFVLIVNYCAL